MVNSQSPESPGFASPQREQHQRDSKVDFDSGATPSLSSLLKSPPITRMTMTGELLTSDSPTSNQASTVAPPPIAEETTPVTNPTEASSVEEATTITTAATYPASSTNEAQTDSNSPPHEDEQLPPQPERNHSNSEDEDYDDYDDFDMGNLDDGGFDDDFDDDTIEEESLKEASMGRVSSRGGLKKSIVPIVSAASSRASARMSMMSERNSMFSTTSSMRTSGTSSGISTASPGRSSANTAATSSSHNKWADPRPLKNRRTSSLDLRRLPTDILLMPSADHTDFDEDDEDEDFDLDDMWYLGGSGGMNHRSSTATGGGAGGAASNSDEGSGVGVVAPRQSSLKAAFRRSFTSSKSASNLAVPEALGDSISTIRTSIAANTMTSSISAVESGATTVVAGVGGSKDKTGTSSTPTTSLTKIVDKNARGLSATTATTTAGSTISVTNEMHGDDSNAGGAHDMSRTAASRKSVKPQEQPESIWKRMSCFNSRYTLRAQFMLSFGTVNALAVVMVVVTCIVVAWKVGEEVKKINQEAFVTTFGKELQGTTVVYLAEGIQQQFMPTNLIGIISEATQDRFVGYPNDIFHYKLENFTMPVTTTNQTAPIGESNTTAQRRRLGEAAAAASIRQRQELRERQQRLAEELYHSGRRRRNLRDDESQLLSFSGVPYRDALTGQNIYPTIGPELYLDWEIPPYINETNYKEHVQESRWDAFYKSKSASSTESAIFIMQGACDPTDDRFSNCTSGSNDVTVGGTAHPLPSTYAIYQGSRDLVPILKGIHESKEEIRNLGVYFANQGAGASVNFPAFPITTSAGRSEITTYESIGCDWMKEPNPMDESLGPIGTEEEIARCQVEGTVVSNQFYNPLERGWCKEQALNPHKTIVSVINDAWSDNWLLGMGRSIYDRSTNAFMACTYISVSLDLAGKKLNESLFSDKSVITLVRYDENGTVIASTNQTEETKNGMPRIDQLSVGVSQKHYKKVRDIFNHDDQEGDWVPEEARKAYEDCFVNDKGYFVTVAPIPSIPDEYDSDYKPQFLVFMSTSESDVLPGVNSLNESVNDQVKAVFVFCLIAGMIGLGATTLVIMFMTNALTTPLRYINEAADEIVDNFGETAAKYKTPGAALLQASIDSIQYFGGRIQNSFAKMASMRSLLSKHDRDEATHADGDDHDDDVDLERLNSIIKSTNKKNQKQTEKQNSSEMTVEDKVITSTGWCTPKTELTDVLQEFNLMVANFSGSLMSSSEKGKRIEIRNRFPLRKEFTDLYSSRSDDIKNPSSPKFKYQLQVNMPSPRRSFAREVPTMAGFIHNGSNLIDDEKLEESTKNLVPTASGAVTNLRKRFSSRLFLWTVALIVTPLLITTITISTFVTSSVESEFRRSVDDAKKFYEEVRLDALKVHATLRADFVAGQLESGPVKDLYLTTRYMGWLFFGAVDRAFSFTELLNGTEQCKDYAYNLTECPFMTDERLTCDCGWNDDRFRPCKEVRGGSRHLQVPAFSTESSLANPENGDRNVTGYPDVAYSPNTTEWWDDVFKVPGWEKGPEAAGHDTLYDRLRVASAMPLFPVLHNADVYKESYIASYVGLEADGTYMGYGGCDIPTPIGSSSWVSTVENRGPFLREDLCPEGKHGYDPRCRSWYNTGRNLALDRNRRSTLHITAPYVFAVSKINAQSATSPLIDPKTGEHVGQVLQDFFSGSIFNVLDESNTKYSKEGFPILIAVEDDDGKNTIIGPDYNLGDSAQSIVEVVLPDDGVSCNTAVCKEHRDSFVRIEKSMKDGNADVDGFTRTKPAWNDDDGDRTNERVFVAFHPVNVRSLRPIDSSDFTRGVEPYDELIYSLGLCEPAESLFKPFEQIEMQIHQQIRWAISILSVMILVASLFVVYISYVVTSSITRPIIYLLDLIRRINRTDFTGGGPPRIKNSMMGSLELANVSDTVIVLYKVVRAANEFFYSGELEMAYKVLKDALKLFKRLDNKKAVAVASNNLGNTLLVMYREMVAENLVENKILKLTKKDLISKGTGYYHDAIQLGEKAYDEFYETEGWTPNCLDFMQHLSNRYFNRALFLLSIKDDHDQPDEIEALGIRDLEISRDMDFEIVEYGADIGFNRVSRAEKLFAVNLIRSRGHNILLEMGYPDDKMLEHNYPEDWELEERLNENFQLLQSEHKRRACNPKLFQDVTVLGRLQEVETVLMRYKMLMGDVECAAKIAIRMLQEDEYAFADSFSQAVEVLLAYVDVAPSSCTLLPKTASRNKMKRDLVGCTEWLEHEMNLIQDRESASLRRSSSVSSSISVFTNSSADGSRLSAKFAGNNNSSRRLAMLDWINKQAAGGYVTMEDF